MNLIVLIAIAAIALLILNSIRKRDPEAEACAQAIIDKLKQNKDSSAEELAQVLKQHGRNADDAGAVLKRVFPKLTQAGFRKEEQADVKLTLRRTKQYI